MNERINKIIKGFVISFWILAGCVLLGFLFSEVFIPGEDCGINYNCKQLPVEWRRVYEDDTREAVKVPGSCSAGKGEQVIIEATLPEDVTDMPWLCFRSSQQDMEIYIDSVLRHEYSTEDTRVFGKNSASAFVFMNLKQEDAGKNLQVVTRSYSSYSGVLNEVYCGDTLSIWQYFFKLYGMELATAVLIMILGVVCIIFCAVLRLKYKRMVAQEFLGWGMFLTSLWVVAESRLRQLFLPNTSVAGNLAFLMAMLLPIPFLIYVNYIQKMRYWKAYVAGMLLAGADFVICVVLQMTNQRDFLENMFLIYVTLIATIIIVGVTIIRDIKKHYIREYTLVAIGCVGLMVGGIVEMILIVLKILSITGLALSLGLLFLLIMASVKTGQDLFADEKKKEHTLATSEAKMGFLANMSHEIRTPINTVIGMNEMILRENRDQEIQKYAGEIHKAGNMLLAMINEMLDFSKITAGDLEIENASYYLASLLNDAIHDIDRKAEEKKLEVVLNIEEELPSELQGDEIRIKQILNHLISNAIKFTEQGRITFTVQGKRTAQEDFWLIISIADTGIGIRQEDLGHLFDSFVRMEEKKNRSIEGTGLGLNIAKQLTDKMQGEISVQSVYGKGSIFTVKIPQVILNEEKIGNLQAAYEQEVKDIRHYRELFRAPEAHVLAVDDNQMNLKVVKSLLKKTDIQLDFASGGDEALELMAKKQYHLILLDHMMPEPDGVQVLHMLREKKDNPNVHTPVIVLTANAVAGIKDWYKKEGFDDYLSKPIMAEKLEKMIKTYLPEELLILQEDMPETEDYDFESVVEAAMEEVVAQQKIKSTTLISPEVGLGYCMNDEELYYDILQTYYDQGSGYQQRMAELYLQGDWKELAIIVHAIKSTSLNIGASEMSERAKCMEEYAKEADAAKIQGQWQEFIDMYGLVLQQAEEVLGTVQEDTPVQEQMTAQTESRAAIEKDDYMQECEVLLEYIRAYAMQEAMEQIEKLQKVICSGVSEEADDMLNKVSAAVEGFSYDEAEEILLEWLPTPVTEE